MVYIMGVVSMVRLGEVISKHGLRKSDDALRLLKDSGIDHEHAEQLVVIACKIANDNKRKTILLRDVEGLVSAFNVGVKSVH